jgi:hypothetical protein
MQPTRVGCVSLYCIQLIEIDLVQVSAMAQVLANGLLVQSIDPAPQEVTPSIYVRPQEQKRL